ncbi:Midasin [Diplonema papillatum]|nr:Midasin [Diplonema papillatum]
MPPERGKLASLALVGSLLPFGSCTQAVARSGDRSDELLPEELRPEDRLEDPSPSSAAQQARACGPPPEATPSARAAQQARACGPPPEATPSARAAQQARACGPPLEATLSASAAQQARACSPPPEATPSASAAQQARVCSPPPEATPSASAAQQARACGPPPEATPSASAAQQARACGPPPEATPSASAAQQARACSPPLEATPSASAAQQANQSSPPGNHAASEQPAEVVETAGNGESPARRASSCQPAEAAVAGGNAEDEVSETQEASAGNQQEGKIPKKPVSDYNIEQLDGAPSEDKAEGHDASPSEEDVENKDVSPTEKNTAKDDNIEQQDGAFSEDNAEGHDASPSEEDVTNKDVSPTEKTEKHDNIKQQDGTFSEANTEGHDASPSEEDAANKDVSPTEKTEKCDTIKQQVGAFSADNARGHDVSPSEENVENKDASPMENKTEKHGAFSEENAEKHDASSEDNVENKDVSPTEKNTAKHDTIKQQDGAFSEDNAEGHDASPSEEDVTNNVENKDASPTEEKTEKHDSIEQQEPRAAGALKTEKRNAGRSEKEDEEAEHEEDHTTQRQNDEPSRGGEDTAAAPGMKEREPRKVGRSENEEEEAEHEEDHASQRQNDEQETAATPGGKEEGRPRKAGRSENEEEEEAEHEEDHASQRPNDEQETAATPGGKEEGRPRKAVGSPASRRSSADDAHSSYYSPRFASETGDRSSAASTGAGSYAASSHDEEARPGNTGKEAGCLPHSRRGPPPPRQSCRQPRRGRPRRDRSASFGPRGAGSRSRRRRVSRSAARGGGRQQADAVTAEEVNALQVVTNVAARKWHLQLRPTHINLAWVYKAADEFQDAVGSSPSYNEAAHGGDGWMTLDTFNESHFVECDAAGDEDCAQDADLITSPRSALLVLRNGLAVEQLCRRVRGRQLAELARQGVPPDVAKLRFEHHEVRRSRIVAVLREQYARVKSLLSRRQLARLLYQSAQTQELKALASVATRTQGSILAPSGSFNGSLPCAERRSQRLLKEKHLGLPSAPVVYDAGLQLLVGQVRDRAERAARREVAVKKRILQDQRTTEDAVRTREERHTAGQQPARLPPRDASHLDRARQVKAHRDRQTAAWSHALLARRENKKKQVEAKKADYAVASGSALAAANDKRCTIIQRSREIAESKQAALERRIAEIDEKCERIQVLHKIRHEEDLRVRAEVAELKRLRVQQALEEVLEKKADMEEEAKGNSDAQWGEYRRGKEISKGVFRTVIALKKAHAEAVRKQKDSNVAAWVSGVATHCEKATLASERLADARRKEAELARERARLKAEDRVFEKNRLRAVSAYRGVARLETQDQKHRLLDESLEQRRAAALQARMIKDAARVHKEHALRLVCEESLRESKALTFSRNNSCLPLVRNNSKSVGKRQQQSGGNTTADEPRPLTAMSSVP